jgi:muconate cycloisomerase
MKIRSYKEHVVQLPSRRVHNWASKMQTPIGHHYILELLTDEGVTGWGETPAIATWGGPHGMYYGEDCGTVSYVIEHYLFPAVDGHDPRRIGAAHAAMNRAIKGHPYAKAAVDIALYDIAGKAAGVPVYQLLGGKLRDGLPICHSLGIMDTDKALDEAVRAVGEGVRTIKCKTGLDARRDIDLVRQLRERVGADITIRIDANEGYATVQEAVHVTNAMAPYNVAFHEQPVAGFDALAQVARRIDIPVMADESAWTTEDILRLHDLDAAQIISLYTTKPGGLYRAQQLAVVAGACGMTCDIGGSIEMGVGVAANLHLGVSVEILRWASVCPVPNVDGRGPVQMAGVYYLDDVIAAPLEFKDGHLLVPDGPGLGVEVDRTKLERYARH